eukprot:GHUV01003796.1.p1 GENE.GHUV01003796.1~~GHUV01003796.1.p1  ORF type:complete len:213 (+),score=29.55 GHUV01003796.1:118-756(+)
MALPGKCLPGHQRAFTAHRPSSRVLRRPVHTRAAVDTRSLVDDLQQLISSRQALDTSPQLESKILWVISQLRNAHRDVITTDSKLLSATWKLLWTTEKETLFILKNAPIFGTKAGDVYQVIDVEAKRLQNVITFPPSGAFIVDSSISVEGPQRVNFKFNSAKLKTASRDFGVPPFGQGWFDTVYCDGTIRVAQDIRGDTLVVVNDGPPRIFT